MSVCGILVVVDVFVSVCGKTVVVDVTVSVCDVIVVSVRGISDFIADVVLV